MTSPATSTGATPALVIASRAAVALERPRTAAERLAAIEEQVIRRFGAAGVQLVDEERSRP